MVVGLVVLLLCFGCGVVWFGCVVCFVFGLFCFVVVYRGCLSDITFACCYYSCRFGLFCCFVLGLFGW